MRVQSRAEINKESWDAFCLAHEGAWFLWTSAYLDYQAARWTQELSFGIMDGDQLVAICPLFLEEHDGERSFTMEGHPGPGPIAKSPQQDWAEIIATGKDHVNTLAAEYKASRVAYRWSPFSLDIPTVTGLARDMSFHTQLLDLTQSEAALHAGLRKSYTSLINHINLTHDVVVDDKGDLLKAFKRLHFGQAGRQTRPDRTWEIQREWCEAGNGLIVAAMRWNVAVACTYWLMYKGCAYYCSSASISRSIIHACVWKAMLELKARGVKTLEMGWTDYDKSEKGQGIARFKQGFGGFEAPVIAVERRWDR